MVWRGGGVNLLTRRLAPVACQGTSSAACEQQKWCLGEPASLRAEAVLGQASLLAKRLACLGTASAVFRQQKWCLGEQHGELSLLAMRLAHPGASSAIRRQQKWCLGEHCCWGGGGESEEKG